MSAIFDAVPSARALYKDQDPPDALTQIIEEYMEIRRGVNDNLTVDYGGPGWRQKSTHKEWEGEAPEEASGSLEERLLRREARGKTLEQRLRRQESFFHRASMLSRKTPEQIKKLIEKHAISDIKTLAEKLKVDRSKFYRRVVDPTRDEK